MSTDEHMLVDDVTYKTMRDAMADVIYIVKNGTDLRREHAWHHRDDVYGDSDLGKYVNPNELPDGFRYNYPRLTHEIERSFARQKGTPWDSAV